MRNYGKTFGESRDKMKKVYVEAIYKQKFFDEPGPANYDIPSSFGQKNGSVRYTMRPRNDMFKIHLLKQKKLPGPGEYASKLDTLGGRHPNSNLQNSPSGAFMKAHDRFGGPYQLTS